MKTKFSFWRLTFYASLTILMIWVILKSAGIINTPLWIEYGVPITSLVIAVLSLFHELIKGIGSIKIDIALLKNQFSYVNTKVEKIETKVDHLDKDIEIIKIKINAA